jgi:endonuclease-3 related protein
MNSHKKKLNQIYSRLYKHFGPQHWWPADSAFEVMVGAVLTQNTAWANVERAIKNLKKANALSLNKIYHLPPKKLAQLIRPAGYFNVKAKRLQNLMDFLYNKCQRDLTRLFKKEIPELRQALLKINGVGKETADSIILYAANKPIFVIDAYTKRVLSRHKILDSSKDYDAFQDLFMQNLPRNARLFNEYHALIVRLAKDFCSNQKPKCVKCPIKKI